jgi:DUF1680 family protein
MAMAVSGASVVTRTDASAHARLRAVPVGAVTLHDGLWQRRVAANREHGIPRLLERMDSRGAIDNFLVGRPDTPGLVRRGYWFSDSDVYKWLEAAAWSLAGHEDGALAEDVSRLVDAIAGAQDPDGYLNTNFRASTRLRDLGWSHELYCAGHLFQAAIALRRVTGDDRLLDASTRFAAFIDEQLRDGTSTDGHPGVEMALVELARETDEERWRDLAAVLSSRVDLGEDSRLWGHAVRSLYFACGLTDLAIETGDTARIATVEALWSSLLEERSYVTGAVGGRWIGESFGRPYELPNEGAYAETCGGVAVAMWAWRQLLRTGDAHYADQLEHVLHNAVLAGVSLAGDEWFYANPLSFAALREHDPWGADRLAEDMAGPFPLRRRPWRDVACCPTNMVRMLASLPGYVYALDRERDDLWINLFTASTVEHGGWKVTQRTDYPWRGRVEIVVDRAPRGRRALVIRVPGWCRPVVGGSTGDDALLPGTYTVVRRTWKSGDSVVLDLQMEPEALVCDPRVVENRGAVALRRGPVVYCFEGADNPDVDLRAVTVDPGSFAAEEPTGLLDGIVVLRGKGGADPGGRAPLYRRAGTDDDPPPVPVALAAIPYFAWANRGLHPMTVWAREDVR